MSIDRFSPSQAIEFLQEQAEYFTSENYHAEASACHTVMDRVNAVKGPMTFVMVTSDTVVEFIVDPALELPAEPVRKYMSKCCLEQIVLESPGSGDLTMICSSCNRRVGHV